MIVKIKFYDTLEGLSHSIGLFRKEDFVKLLRNTEKIRGNEEDFALQFHENQTCIFFKREL